jgi:hypothetical protein
MKTCTEAEIPFASAEVMIISDLTAAVIISGARL